MSTRDHPDWWRPMGGQNSQDSILERRSLIWNDDGVVSRTRFPILGTNALYKGKFFTRGCRGMIEEIQIYRTATAGGTIILHISPHPCLGPLYTVTIPAGPANAWTGVAFEQMWNYDSLFIWTSYVAIGEFWGYDAAQPYDGHISEDAGATWADWAARPFIRVIYTGETPGDVPVSGIINNIPIPSISSRSLELERAFSANSETPIIGLYRAGYCDYITAEVDAKTNSHLTYIRVHCDGALALEAQYEDLFNNGYNSESPTVSLCSYGVDNLCYLQIHKRFEFRRSFFVLAYNLPTGQIVSVAIHPTLMR